MAVIFKTAYQGILEYEGKDRSPDYRFSLPVLQSETAL